MEPSSSKHSNFSSRASSENVRPSRFPHATNGDLVQRPFSALARHRIHELSDIREVSGCSSQGGTVRRKLSGQIDGASEPDHHLALPSGLQKAAAESLSSEYNTPRGKPATLPSTPLRGLGSRAPSAMSLPLSEVPERRSSASVLGHNATGSRTVSIQDFPSWKLPPPSAAGQIIPRRGHADSPVRSVLKNDVVSSELLRRSPSRTFIRTTSPLDVLEHGSSRHARVDMSVRLPSPLFVGGGTIEGQIALKIDANAPRRAKLKQIFISKLSVDVIGVEEVNDGRRWIFLSLATELLDENHPPPLSLVSSQQGVSEREQLWQLKACSATIPFCLNLPLNLGPPPYLSKQAGIRYLLCPTAVIKIGEKRHIIRQTWNIQMLTVYDPEKALASLPSPLLASDTLSLSNGPEVQSLKVTAGLHRQTWVDGSAIFVDIHIANNSLKSVKRIEVQIEKSTLWYLHSAAGTAEKSANHLRLPKRTDSEIISTSVTKKNKDWKGVPPRSSEVRTCDISAPRGHVTISTGRYFEVRYYLNVIVTVGMFKAIAVQLPVILIHMNSLDILPNSLAQVAASIEAKRARTVPVKQDPPLYLPYHQGQAFTAPRRQSLDPMRNEGKTIGDDIDALAHDLENSPRRFGSSFPHCRPHRAKLSHATPAGYLAPRQTCDALSAHYRHMRHPSCYHCHLLYDEDLGRKPLSAADRSGLKLPRLQISTSGLGFSDSEFEVPPDSPPRKVMLSENERKMINQQRELKIQREFSQKSRKRAGHGDVDKEQAVEGIQEGYWGWKNVAAAPNAGPKQPEFGNLSRPGVIGENGGFNGKRAIRESAPARARSRTNPEAVGSRHARPRRSARSVDRTSRMMPGMSAEGPRRSLERRRSTRQGRKT